MFQFDSRRNKEERKSLFYKISLFSGELSRGRFWLLSAVPVVYFFSSVVLRENSGLTSQTSTRFIIIESDSVVITEVRN